MRLQHIHITLQYFHVTQHKLDVKPTRIRQHFQDHAWTYQKSHK